jgi:hypothetical protein
MDLQQAFESGKFEVKNLTVSINNAEVPRTRLAELGLFEEQGVSTTSVEIEYQDGQIILVPEKPRGAPGTNMDDRERKTYTFNAIHLPLEDSIKADAVQNVRAFGSETEAEMLQTVIDNKMQDMKASQEATLEFLRVGAMFGKVMGATGKVIEDLYARFGISAKDLYDEIDFSGTIRTQLLGSKRKSETAQKGVKAKNYRAFCSPEFFDKLLEDEGFQKAFDRFQNGSALRDDVRSGVKWNDIIWEEFDTTVGSTVFIKAGEAALVPMDKPKLFITRFAPANYAETVNTIGLPHYAKAELKKYGKGVDIESQSNPIVVCTAPLAVRRLKIKAAA